MKIKEFMKVANDYLGAENRKRKSKIKCLKQVLKKLRKREKKLEIKFKQSGVNKEKISNELAIIRAHRKKGLSQMKTLKKSKKKK